jgi:hypothetical protein
MTDGNVWTEEMALALARLHRDKRDISFSVIARELSAEFNLRITANACIGKSRRLGLPMRNNTPRKPKGRKPIPKKLVEAPIPPPPGPRPILPVTAPVAGQYEYNTADAAAGISADQFSLDIYQLRDGDCKWVLGAMEDRPPFRYCGHPAPLGRPYCVRHHRLSYNKPAVVWK